MRKYHKKQLLDLVQTIKEANIMIERFIRNENYESATGLLIDCHEAAVNIGKRIEELEGEGTITVTYLEEYCDLLYQTGLAVNENKNLKKELVLLHNQIIKIEDSLINDIKADKLEVVFLPYKASMWDSLESIYLVAKNDPQCDVYCVPIPYYELTPDSKLGQMYYEGADYYDSSIEVTNWKEYDIEARHPDMIFIHYPYDDMAVNATVHPDFYSKKLRQCCDCLAYVPYFVVSGNTVAEYNACLPGVLYADCVFVQSEQIRQSYIQHYNNFARENKMEQVCGRGEDKFKAFGSPKFDKIINDRDAHYELPDNWKRLVYRGNGEKKKIVLYNTHMFAWINGGEQYFRKMQIIFETFRDREDAVLWWRPHPNTELNFRTFRPDLLGKYMKTVESYKNGGWGIYDDTPDLHRAIAFSDVYYGDGSSLVELFKAGGKPVYYQDIDFPELLDNLRFYVTNIFETGNSLYALTFNGYMFRLEDNSFKYESKIPASYGYSSGWNYYSQVTEDDNIFFIPHNEKHIAVYNVKTKDCRMYALDLDDEYRITFAGGDKNFLEGILYKNKLFLVPWGYRNIVAFNTNTKETEHCLDLRQVFGEKTNALSYGYAWLNESTVLLASMHSNEVLEFNLDTYEYKIHRIGREDQSFHMIFRYGDNFFLVGRQPFMLRWNYETGDTHIYDKLPADFELARKLDWVFYVRNMKPYGNKLVLPGGYTNMVLLFDLDTCQFEKLDVFDKLLKSVPVTGRNKDEPFVTGIHMSGSFMYFVHKNEILYRYDFDTQTIEEVCSIMPFFSDEQLDKLNGSFIRNMLEGENSQVMPERFNKLYDGKAGERIYSYIKTRLFQKPAADVY